MRRLFNLAALAVFAAGLACYSATEAAATDPVRSPARLDAPEIRKEAPSFSPEALRSGRSFRSPRMGYTGGGARTGVRNPGAGQPVSRTPAAPAARPGGFLGGLFGGFLAGSLLSSLLNPFGFGGGGFSLIGLLVWIVILYAVYRLIRWTFSRQR